MNQAHALDAVSGALLGCAVGDAIGLPYEGLSKRRGIRLLGEPSRHRFVIGRGMVSDDTEHTCMVAQALCENPTDPSAFARDFSRRLRWWLLGLPAGIGWATLRATVKLWLGFSAEHSGVFSAGNGPAMRSAILGAAIDDIGTLKCFVRSVTVVTHTDPKAYHGAFAVALAAWCARHEIDPVAGFFERHHAVAGDATSDEFSALMPKVKNSIATGQTTVEFAEQLGCAKGVSGYVLHTVPVALHAWLRHPRDYPAALTEVIRCGGDTDTTGAIVGAIVGSAVGRSGIPREWLSGLWEWPRSSAWMERLAESVVKAVNTRTPTKPPSVIPGIGLVRNALFLLVVVVHVIRRLLPPY